MYIPIKAPLSFGEGLGVRRRGNGPYTNLKTALKPALRARLVVAFVPSGQRSPVASRRFCADRALFFRRFPVRLPFAIPPFFRSFYFLSSVTLAGWLLFFDGNDLISQYQRRQKLGDLERERDYYKGKIADVQRERDALLNNPDLLEKFARERYLMKRPHEAVYVIVRDSIDKID